MLQLMLLMMSHDGRDITRRGKLTTGQSTTAKSTVNNLGQVLKDGQKNTLQAR